MLVCARLRHAAGTQWGSKKSMNTKRLEAVIGNWPLQVDFMHARVCNPICEKALGTTVLFQYIAVTKTKRALHNRPQKEQQDGPK